MPSRGARRAEIHVEVTSSFLARSVPVRHGTFLQTAHKAPKKNTSKGHVRFAPKIIAKGLVSDVLSFNSVQPKAGVPITESVLCLDPDREE